MDAALQLLVALAPTPDEAWVPVKIGGFTVRNPIPDGESLNLRASILPVAPSADMMVGKAHLYNAAGLELASFESVTLQSLTGAPGRRIEDWLHEIEWVRAARSTEFSATAARTLPAPSDFDPLLVSARARDLEGDVPVNELVRELRLLCGVFVVQAVRRLGWGLREGERVPTADVAQRFGVIERHQRLLNRLFEMLTEDGLVRRDGADWLVTRTAPAADPATSLQALQARFPACAVELTLLGRCAEMLDRVLVGECDPLQLLFPEGSLQSAGRLYQDSSFSRTCNDMVREAVKAMVASVPEGRPLRVLEIGGGTGGTTAHVLPLLPAGQSRYVFTDISSLFTTRAAEKFWAFPFVEYRVLDISGEPVAQGFPAGEFDLIIAANVLHATPDLRQTLRTTRDLLAPGGELLLVEGTEHSRWIDLIFGLIEGWWLFSDDELRTSHPLVSRDRWPRVLHECGFAETIAVANATPDQTALFEQAVIVARKPCSEVQASVGRWLVFCDGGGLADRLATTLAGRGAEVTKVRAGESWQAGEDGFTIRPSEVGDFTRLLEEVVRGLSSSLAGIAYLWPVAMDANATPEAAQQLTCDAPTFLMQALTGSQGEAGRLLRGARLWIVTRGTQPAEGGAVVTPLAAPAWGVGRVIALEHPALNCSLVDLAPDHEDVTGLAEELLSADTANQVSLRKTGRFEARVVRADLRAPAVGIRLAVPTHRAYRLTTRKPGTLDGLEFRTVARQRPGRDKVEIRVEASGLNFRDVFVALGMLPDPELLLGLDAAGVVTAVGKEVREFKVGDAVMAFADGAFGSFVTASSDLVARRPAGLTAEQAAAIPVVFLTAHHALRSLARIKRGDRVLIHAASGGVGMAAVQIALQEGCEVFGTAGNPRKRGLLRTMGVQHVLDSRSLAFADEITRLTAGCGVDVVLNSLAGDFIAKSFEALAADGRFIEIGKTRVWSPQRARAARPNAFYEVFDLIQVGRREPARIRAMFAQLVNEFENGRLKPPPIETYSAEQTLEAFRAMSQARHVGKIVITHQVRSSVVEPDSQFRRDEAQLPTGAAFLITGGYGGLGLLLADWLAAQGVRHFVLLGRRAPDPGAKEKIAALERTGATVLCAQGDVASEADVRAVLNAAARSLPPLAGVFHCAGALDDGVLVQMNSARFRTVLAPKVVGAGILDRLTRDLPIQRFVMFSSWASMFGSPGQANHSAANAYLDALAHARRAQGLAGQSINWGPWTQIGAAAAHADRLGSRGIGCFSPREGLTALNMLLKADRVQTAVVPFDVEKWQATAPASSRTRLFEKLRTGKPVAAIEASANAAGPARVDIRLQLTAAPGERQRARVMETWLREQAAAVLRLPPARVESDKPLKTLGFDSLLAVEFRNRLETSLGLQLPATLIWNYPSLAQLGPNLIERLAAASPPAPAVNAEPANEHGVQPGALETSAVAQLSEAEAERQLEQHLRNLDRSLMT
ncbi:MAG TPA: SDR family NAD(P)-dependent oxidoreductase [Povalibacter sp.]